MTKPKKHLGLDVDINTWLFILLFITQKDSVRTVEYPAQAKGSGCMFITADLAHRLITDLKLTSRYYNKIFHCISGPPKWLTRNLRQMFEAVETADSTAFL